MVPRVAFLLRVPIARPFQRRLNLGRRWSPRPLELGTEELVPALPPPLPAQGSLAMTRLAVEEESEEGGVPGLCDVVTRGFSFSV